MSVKARSTVETAGPANEEYVPTGPGAGVSASSTMTIRGSTSKEFAILRTEAKLSGVLPNAYVVDLQAGADDRRSLPGPHVED